MMEQSSNSDDEEPTVDLTPDMLRVYEKFLEAERLKKGDDTTQKVKVEKLSLSSNDHKQEEYLKDFPNGTLPALKEARASSSDTAPAFILTETAAICRYLGSKYSQAAALTPPAGGNCELWIQIHEMHSFFSSSLSP